MSHILQRRKSDRQSSNYRQLFRPMRHGGRRTQMDARSLAAPSIAFLSPHETDHKGSADDSLTPNMRDGRDFHPVGTRAQCSSVRANIQTVTCDAVYLTCRNSTYYFYKNHLGKILLHLGRCADARMLWILSFDVTIFV